MRRSEFMMGGLDFKGLVVAQMMETNVATTNLDSTWHDITRTITEQGFGDVPIVDANNKILGIVTEYDLLKALMESRDIKNTTAKDIMTKNVVCVTEETHVSEIINILETKHFIRLPVVKNGKLVGIVARRDVLLAYINATEKPPGSL